ncbi:hypothetical protein Lal_00023571 [Lupinus albus]|nr:hypothetical protein Lal_00023571 [Lupinus albus]
MDSYSSLFTASTIVKRYTIGRDDVVISHLQYADDTLLIGETLLLMCHFSKAFRNVLSCHLGSKSIFIRAVLLVVGSIPFKFIGIHVSANPKRLSTWSPVIDSFRKKLSLAAKTYFLSWTSNSSKVGNPYELDKIHRIFHVGRGEVSKLKKKVCRSKDDWGLRVNGDGDCLARQSHFG